MAAPETPGPPSWASVLAELESAVAHAEQLLADGARSDAVAAWCPPTDLGPLPDEFRDRAAVLLERQAAVAEAVGAQLESLQRRRQVTHRRFPQPSRRTAAYFDKSL